MTRGATVVLDGLVSPNRDLGAARSSHRDAVINLELFLTTLCILGVASGVISSTMSLAALALRAGAHRLPEGTMPISVLKPVRGLDDEFEENLESFCVQTHPKYELVIGAEDPTDPALAAARRVSARHPTVPIRIVAGAGPSGCNPKVRNLRKLMSKARYPAVLVSDGDVRVAPNYLSVMAAALAQPNVGLVSNLVVGIGERTIGAACENRQLNGFVIGGLAASSTIARHPTIIGKSMLFRRDALTNSGGFAAAADVLAEDYLLGRAVAKAGYRVVTLGHPVYAVNRDWTLSRTLRRHVRWNQIRRHVAPGVFALEPLGHPVLWVILLLAVTPQLDPSNAAMAFEWMVSTAVAGTAALLQVAIAAHLSGRSMRLRDLWLAPLATMLALIAWVRAWTCDTVTWRQQHFRIGRGSQLLPIGEYANRAGVGRVPKPA